MNMDNRVRWVVAYVHMRFCVTVRRRGIHQSGKNSKVCSSLFAFETLRDREKSAYSAIWPNQ